MLATFAPWLWIEWLTIDSIPIRRSYRCPMLAPETDVQDLLQFRVCFVCSGVCFLPCLYRRIAGRQGEAGHMYFCVAAKWLLFVKTLVVGTVWDFGCWGRTLCSLLIYKKCSPCLIGTRTLFMSLCIIPSCYIACTFITRLPFFPWYREIDHPMCLFFPNLLYWPCFKFSIFLSKNNMTSIPVQSKS